MEKEFKILLLEDNEHDAVLLERELRRAAMKFQLTRVDNREDFVKQLKKMEPDVILSDHSLPSFSSLEALPIARSSNPGVPFILVTGTISEQFAMECIQEGVDDYILKQSLTRLPSSILNAYDKKRAEREREINLRMLQEANTELKNFIYRASHDIRGPICSLKGLINICKMKSLDFDMDQLVGFMDKGISRLDDIVLQLLETMELRDEPLRITKVDPETTLQQILNEIPEELASVIRRNVTLSVLKPLETDQKFFRVILESIVDNAYRHHWKTGRERFIDIIIANEKNHLVCVVKDNGPGIASEVQEHVFDMFFRASENADGNGLGLYLAKISAGRLNGTIDIKSHSGNGTTVTVKLPLQPVPQEIWPN